MDAFLRHSEYGLYLRAFACSDDDFVVDIVVGGPDAVRVAEYEHVARSGCAADHISAIPFRSGRIQDVAYVELILDDFLEVFVYEVFRIHIAVLAVEPVVLLVKGITIYYSYQNTAGDIIVRSITDLQELYRISSAKSPDCQKPLLLSFQETLLLFYVIQNPIGNNFYLKALCPFQPEKHIVVPDKNFLKSPAILALPSNQGILICAFTNDTQCVLYMDSNFNCHDISRTDDNDDKIDKTVLLKNVEQLQKELHERDAIIESIKRQYAELMDTASKYKAEAEKWHDLAYKKDVRPVPGERLLSDDW